MTKSELFKAAHKLAKSVIQSGDDYRVTFGAAIKVILKGDTVKASVKEWNKKGYRFYVEMEAMVWGKLDMKSIGYVELVNKELNFSNIDADMVERVKFGFAQAIALNVKRHGAMHAKPSSLIGSLQFTIEV